MRYYVAADIHGFFTPFHNALEAAGYYEDNGEKKIVICGDLLDRGAEARQTQDFVLEMLRSDQIILIRGNHEDLFCDLVKKDRGLPYNHHVHNGTYQTALDLTDYDIGMAGVRHFDFAEAARNTPYYREIIPAMLKDELEGRSDADMESQEREEAAKTFQVVSGDMFSRIHDPVVRIGRSSIAFNAACAARMNCEYAEILFNPVERMMVVRPCAKDHPNAIPWGSKPLAASSLVRMLYDSMGWEEDYTYRVPCQTIQEPDGDGVVLGFDLDNYIGRAINKKEEVIMARKQEELAEEQREDAKSYYYPPEEDDEPQEIRDMEERFQKAREQNRKIFGEPVFQHSTNMRGFSGQKDTGEWDMLIEARPLDVDHRVDDDTVASLFQEIVDNPPELPRDALSYGPSVSYRKALPAGSVGKLMVSRRAVIKYEQEMRNH